MSRMLQRQIWSLCVKWYECNYVDPPEKNTLRIPPLTFKGHSMDLSCTVTKIERDTDKKIENFPHPARFNALRRQGSLEIR